MESAIVTDFTQQDEIQLKRLLAVIDELRKIDPDMQLPMAASLLLVALQEDITRTDVMNRLEVAGSTATRNLLGLTAQGRLGRPGHDLVEQRVNPEERRWRLHRLTPKGRRFVKRIAGIMAGRRRGDSR